MSVSSTIFRKFFFVSALAVFSLAVLGAGRGDRVNASRFIGAEACGQCHTAAYAAWKKSPHARARLALTGRDKNNPACLSCHTMDPDDNNPALQGIQCETCHGAGRYYSPRHVMRDADLRVALGFQKPGESTCKRCHNESAPSISPFEYEHKFSHIVHLDACSKRARDDASDDKNKSTKP